MQDIFSLGAMGHKLTMPDSQGALISNTHAVNGNSTVPPFPDDTEMSMFAMGCFWGPERTFWKIHGVYSTQVGYSGGETPNPTYLDVCHGNTAHTEVVRVVFYPKVVSYEELLRVFWENHNPTQGLRQGSDTGPHYRSGIYYYTSKQQELAEMSRDVYQQLLDNAHKGTITTEIQEAGAVRPFRNWKKNLYGGKPGTRHALHLHRDPHQELKI